MDPYIQHQLIKVLFEFILKTAILVGSYLGLKYVRYFPVSIILSLVFLISGVLTAISTIELIKLMMIIW